MLTRYEEARKSLDAARAAVIIEAEYRIRMRKEEHERYKKQHTDRIHKQLEEIWW